MFLNLNHKELDVYQVSRAFVLECYRITKDFPLEEKFGLIAQIRRAALSVHLNIAEGSSRKSPGERKRYFEVSRGSVIEIDAALDVANGLDYLKNINLEVMKELIIRCFQLLSKMIC